MKNIPWIVSRAILLSVFAFIACKDEKTTIPIPQTTDTEKLPAWNIQPADWILAHIPEDTIGIFKSIAATQYANVHGHLDSTAYFTDKTAERLFAVRLYKGIHLHLYRLTIANASMPDPQDTINKLLDKYIVLLQKQEKSRPIAGQLYFLKGYLLQERGVFLKANDAYLKALSMLPKDKYAKNWLYMFNNIVQNYNSLGDYNMAANFARSIRHFIEVHQHEFEQDIINGEKSRALRAEGWALYEQNNNQEARNRFREALALSEEDQYPDLYTFLSKAFLSEDQIDSAYLYVRKALVVYNKTNVDGVYTDGLHQLARCQLHTGRYREALVNFQKELPKAQIEYGVTHPDYVKIWVYIARTFEKMGRPDSAIIACQQVFRCYNPQFTRLDKENNPDKEHLYTDHWFLEALQMKSRLMNTSYQTNKKIEDLKTALECTILATEVQNRLFEIFETSHSKSEISASTRPLYEQGLQQALILNDPDRAYQFVQLAKAALLREKMAKDNVFGALPDTLKKAWESASLAANKLQLQQDIQPTQQAGKELLDLSLRLKLLKTQIRAIVPGIDLYNEMHQPLDMNFIRQNIPKNAAIIDFFWGDSIIYAICITQNKVQCHQMPRIKDLNESIHILRQTVLMASEPRQCETFLRCSRACFHGLLEQPLQGIQQNDPLISRLWIVPDGPLHFLPFDALLTEDTDACQGPNTPFLLRKYATGFAFSAMQFFPKKDISPESAGGYMGWGIQYDSASLSQVNKDNTRYEGYLPKARKEIEAVQALLSGSVYLNNEATKANFLNHIEKCGIAHLAMHAIADHQSPQNSKLLFSPETGHEKLDEQTLTLQEIYALTLRNKLVVLSACNTAHGLLLPGEGISSLGRAFQFAGAQSVLMTQWNAEDNASFAIVPAFFKQLKTGAEKDIALQQAKLAMLDNPSFAAFQAPLYWAGFVVSGDMQPVLGSDNTKIWWFIAALMAALVLWRRFFKRI